MLRFVNRAAPFIRKYSEYPSQQYGGYYDTGPPPPHHHAAAGVPPPPAHPFSTHQDHASWHQVNLFEVFQRYFYIGNVNFPMHRSVRLSVGMSVCHKYMVFLISSCCKSKFSSIFLFVNNSMIRYSRQLIMVKRHA